MKIRTLKSFTLPTGKEIRAGVEVDLDPADARPLVRGGFAVPIYERIAEQAVRIPTETR